MANKPIICLDFDGVIHRYSKGWQDGRIYDPPVDGFYQWFVEAQPKFKIVVYSSRSKDKEQRLQMMDWLYYHAGRWVAEHPNIGANYMKAMLAEVDFVDTKPPAFLTIDDRALTFNGDWLDCQWEADNLLNFKPWNARHGTDKG